MASQEGSVELSRIRSDYVGAGEFVVLPDDSGVVVNTTYGVQAVGLNGKVAWQADVGGRLSGVTVADGQVFVSSIERDMMSRVRPRLSRP